MSDFRVSFNNQKSASQVLQFIYESGIICDIEGDESFFSLICEELKENKINPIWLNCKSLENIRNKIKESDVSYLLNNTETEEWFYRKMKPNDHFKQYCGAEWLTKDGYITPQQAVEFLKHNISTRCIERVNGKMRLNAWFQGVMQESKEEIYECELKHIVKRFF